MKPDDTPISEYQDPEPCSQVSLPEFPPAHGWYEFPDREAPAVRFLSSSFLGTAGKSGPSGAGRRQELFSALKEARRSRRDDGGFVSNRRDDGSRVSNRRGDGGHESNRRDDGSRESAASFPYSDLLLSVTQVHSMRILRLEQRRGGGIGIELLDARWDDNCYIREPTINLGTWSQQELVRRFGELLALEADGVASNLPWLNLGVTVADCMPVFAKSGSWRALLHSGWAGTGILYRLLTDPAFSGNDSPVEVFLGPCISRISYEVSAERARTFAARFGPASVEGRNLDLAAANLSLLERRRREGADIVCSRTDACTVLHSGLFSYRQSGPGDYGLMLALYAGGNF